MGLVEPRSIDTLIDQLGERIDVLIQERDNLRREVERLVAYAVETRGGEEIEPDGGVGHIASHDAHDEVQEEPQQDQVAQP